MILRGGYAPPVEEKLIRHDDGFVYKQEWWTSWLIERPFNDVQGLLDYIPRNIEEIHNRQFGDMFTFAGKSNVWGASSKSPREQFLELQEKVGENTVIFPNESPVGLDTAHVRAGLDLLAYAYAENPQLVSDWLEALNWAEIQRVHETADPNLSPVALVYSDIASTEQVFFSPKFLRKEFFPRLAKLVDAWHEHGIKVIYHSDGNLWAVLEDFRQAGIDGINPLEPLSKMYAGDVRKAYPEWILMGGIDVSQLLPFGDRIRGPGDGAEDHRRRRGHRTPLDWLDYRDSSCRQTRKCPGHVGRNREVRLLRSVAAILPAWTQCRDNTFAHHSASTTQRKPTVPARSLLGAISKYLPCSMSL